MKDDIENILICDKCHSQYRVSGTWWFVWWVTLPIRVLSVLFVALCMLLYPGSWYSFWKCPQIDDQSKWKWTRIKHKHIP